jgi:hypothetical protein
MVNMMAVENGGTDAGLLALLNQGNRNNSDGMFSGGAGGVLTGLLFGGLLNGNNGLGNGGNRALLASDVQNIVNDSQMAATANSNALLLLKDIQDSSQEVISAVNAGVSAATSATLQAEIANLQGQGVINSAIQEAKYSTTNEVHEAASNVISSTTANTAQLAATMNSLGASLAAGHAEINAAIQQAKYDNTIATMTDGDKTRAAIAALAATIPNSRELDLQRQLTVALDNERHRDLIGRIDSGNVTVTTNVNQAQAQAQMQNQLQTITGTLNGLLHNQNAMATNLNILGVQRGINQTPVNVNQ